MRRRPVTIEISLTSSDLILNVRGNDHPLATYLAAGVPVVLSTDDPGVARIDMTNEYFRAAHEHAPELPHAQVARPQCPDLLVPRRAGEAAGACALPPVVGRIRGVDHTAAAMAEPALDAGAGGRGARALRRDLALGRRNRLANRRVVGPKKRKPRWGERGSQNQRLLGGTSTGGGGGCNRRRGYMYPTHVSGVFRRKEFGFVIWGKIPTNVSCFAAGIGRQAISGRFPRVAGQFDAI